jgi:predicted transcriptional regulator
VDNKTSDGAMVTMRDRATEMIQELLRDADLDEIIDQLHFLAKVDRGLRQIEDGQEVSHEEAKRRFGR